MKRIFTNQYDFIIENEEINHLTAQRKERGRLN